MRRRWNTVCAERHGRRPTGRAALVLLCCAAALASSCVRLTYRRVERFRPPEPQALEALEVDATLAQCLEQLGAPWQVLEQEQQAGLVLVYAWERASGWAGAVSSGQRSIPGSFSLGRSAAGWSSVVLWFDEGDQLVRWEQGSLPAELASALSRRLGS